VKVIITGQGRSGTTALFYAFKKAMPRRTKCFFEPKGFELDDKLLGENILVKILFRNATRYGSYEESSRPVFQFDCRGVNFFDKKIFIVRDPRDRLISQLLYSVWTEGSLKDADKVSGFVKLLENKEKTPKSVSFASIINSRIALSKEALTFQDWLSRCAAFYDFSLQFGATNPDFLVFHYEKLVTGRFDLLERYTGLKFSKNINVEDAYRRVVRTKNAGDWKNWFLEEDVHLFRPIFEKYMRCYGYGSDWTLNSTPHIDPLHASKFVKKLMADRKCFDKRRPGRA